MNQFQQPLTISLQSMGVLAGILLVLALALSLRLGRYISTPLLQLRVWLRNPDEYTPATQRTDEIGDLARQLHAQLAPEPREPEVEPDDIDEDDEPQPALPVRTASKPGPFPPVAAKPAKPVMRQIQADEDEEDFGDDPFADLREAPVAVIKQPVTAVAKVHTDSAVLAVQLGAQEQLRRLPKARLAELLERYHDCLQQAASLYESEVHMLQDGSTLMLFHSETSGDDYLTNAICCGELLRALGHALQIEVADSGITLQLQLGLVLSDEVHGLNSIDLLLTESAQDALALSQHSRNLLLVVREIGEDPLIPPACAHPLDRQPRRRLLRRAPAGALPVAAGTAIGAYRLTGSRLDVIVQSIVHFQLDRTRLPAVPQPRSVSPQMRLISPGVCYALPWRSPLGYSREGIDIHECTYL